MDTKLKPKNKGGRPSKYTPELAAKICAAISNSSKGLAKICGENEDFPVRSTVFEWLHTYPAFSDQYALAKATQAQNLVDEIIDIADDATRDEVIDENGVHCNTEYIARSRLRVDTRKWIASKVLPKVYGDKLQAELSGNKDAPIQIRTKVLHSIHERLERLLGDN